MAEDEKPAGPEQCSVVNGRLQTCWALDELLEWHTPSVKGLTYLQMINLKTGKPSRSLVAVKSGKHRKKGIVANYCPMCGMNIGEHMNPDKSV